jgi:hypothetical protein
MRTTDTAGKDDDGPEISGHLIQSRGESLLRGPVREESGGRRARQGRQEEQEGHYHGRRGAIPSVSAIDRQLPAQGWHTAVTSVTGGGPELHPRSLIQLRVG